jgi:hypothetical protein
MRENDKTMNSMKTNGTVPHITDTDQDKVHPIKLFKSVSPSPVQPGDSGGWKDEEFGSGNEKRNQENKNGSYFLNRFEPE